MTDNSAILSKLNLYAKLAELHDENPFKYKTFTTAAFNLKKIKESFDSLSDNDLLAVPGVGKSVLVAIKQIYETESFSALEECISKTPDGVVDMLKIKGLGPKKVKVIWEEMHIESVSDLLDACRQNRLIEIKGFGLKTQAEIIKGIEFSISASGKWHYARLMGIASEFREFVKKQFPGFQFEYSGDFRRCSEIIEKLTVVTTIDQNDLINFLSDQDYTIKVNDDEIHFVFEGQIPIEIICTDYLNFDRLLFETTGSSEHLHQIDYTQADGFNFTSEEELYESKGLPFIMPEQREGLNELDFNENDQHFIEYGQLKGVLHNHSTYSDGLNTLTEMAEYANSQKFQYLGICDHSKSAGYAGGLSDERVLDQMNEIDNLNLKMSPFKIFKGIESDILSDGSLDYSEDILKLFDFVVASVHSNLTMNEEKANARLLKAIENPYTTILGHPTGRLLLMRAGYQINHELIIDACAANAVVIELNAHPYRLDIDWRWIHYAQKKGVFISINPDAHEKMGYHDMYFGTLAARKGGLLTKNTLNAMNLKEFEAYLINRRKVRNIL
jgi:DNA polymerase (family 10)